MYALLADLVVLVHFLFVAYIVLGGLLAWRWPRAALVHLPCALYGFLIEVVGWVCPLTPLEMHLREQAGREGYEGGFVAHYLLPVLYPPGLTPRVQLALGLGVVVVNVLVYAGAVRHWRRRRA